MPAPTAPGGLVAVVLAAGEGRRLQPLTFERPKALCPLVGVPLLDHALEGVAAVTDQVGVNAWHRADQVLDRLERLDDEPGALGRLAVHASVEAGGAPLGTAGGIGAMRSWIDGRDVLVCNADTWCPADLTAFVAGWDHERAATLLAGADAFGPRVRLAATLLPWAIVHALSDEPTGLYEVCLGPHHAAGRLVATRTDAPFHDCGTPARYLAANLSVAGVVGDGSVVGAGARIGGSVVRSVVWPDAVVAPGEVLVDAVRTTRGRTVLVR